MSARGKKIKILYLVNSLEMGGAERVVVDLVNGLDAAHFDPAICCIQSSGPCASRIQRAGVEVFEMRHFKGNSPFLPVRIGKLIQNNKIDLVHCHGWGPFCEAVMAARWGGAAGFVHTAHGRRSGDFIAPGVLSPLKKMVRHSVEAFLAHWVDQLVVVSDYQKEQLIREMRLDVAKIQTLVNGMTFSNGAVIRNEKRTELGFSPDHLVVCGVGRLAGIKNYRLLLEAVPGILRQEPRARFILAGDGPERETLERLRRDLGLESVVRLLGERSDIAELLAASDLFVLPSDFEATSMALLEAMAAGLPVVATRVGGNPYILSEGETGLLIRPRDGDALSSAVISLLRDPVTRGEMGSKGAAKVRRLFSMEKMLQGYQQIYLRILKDKGRLPWPESSVPERSSNGEEKIAWNVSSELKTGQVRADEVRI